MERFKNVLPYFTLVLIYFQTFFFTFNYSTYVIHVVQICFLSLIVGPNFPASIVKLTFPKIYSLEHSIYKFFLLKQQIIFFNLCGPIIKPNATSIPLCYFIMHQCCNALMTLNGSSTNNPV